MYRYYHSIENTLNCTYIGAFCSSLSVEELYFLSQGEKVLTEVVGNAILFKMKGFHPLIFQ